MADDRERERMVFETTDQVKRAIRMRAGMDGVKPADVVNAALEACLDEELALVRERLKASGDPGGGAPRPARGRRGEQG
jgi:hypothetical protein